MRAPLRCTIAAVATAVFAAGSALAAQSGPWLSVCLAEHDAPRSMRAGTQGFDVDVARLLADHLGRGLRMVWVAERYQTDIESSDVDYRPILSGQCDVQLSAPGPAAIARFGGRLVQSDPYYGAAFELLPKGAAFRWQEPYAGTLAVRANSVAHVAIDAIGVRWTMHADTDGVVSALRDGTAKAALVWGPNLATKALEYDAHFEPPAVLRWNLHAIVRRDDPVLSALNQAFADPSVQRRIRALQRDHGIPPRAPFPSVHTSAALQALEKPQTQASPAAAFRTDLKALRRGKALFVGTCAGYCHSPSVERAAPNLFDCTWQNGSGGDRELFDIIANGVPETAMIGYKGKLPEGDDDIWRLVAYLQAAAPAC